MQWVQSTVVENYLTRLGIKFEWKMVPFEEINLERSLKNQARLITEPLMPEVVERYTLAMEADDASFPGIVAYHTNNGKLLVDGNHRYVAFTNTKPPKGSLIGVYLLKTDDKLLLSLVTRGINSINGVPQSRDEAIEQALVVMEQYPTVAASKISAIFGLSEAVLSQAKRARKVEQFLVSKRVNTNYLSRNTLLELNKLSGNETVLLAASEMIARCRPGHAQLKEIIGGIKEKKSESTQLEAIRKAEDEVTRYSSKPVERKMSIKSQYFRALHTLLALTRKYPSLAHLQITGKSEMEEARNEWKKLAISMGKVFRQ